MSCARDYYHFTMRDVKPGKNAYETGSASPSDINMAVF
jgi:hypothetical protein